MAKAGKKSSTRKPPKTSVSNTSPPIGKRYEQSIHIQQAQRVSLMMWVPMWVRATIARVVARLRPGRPREYDVDGAITGVAKDCATKGVEDYLDRFVARVRHECKLRHIKTPKRSQMRKICRPIWEPRAPESPKSN